MILNHARHGRTRRDAVHLARHLMKADTGGPPVLHAIVGLAALDLDGALHAMRRLAPRGAAAFHHVAISPAMEWNADALGAAAADVVRELGGDPLTHPHAVVLHRKARPSGRGPLHAHVVVSHWAGSGPGLDDAWSRMKLERLARELEWHHGEGLTRGRHDRALAKALRAKGRAEIADALEKAERGTPLPRSVVTAPSRQALARQGVDDVGARLVVGQAWARCDTPASLRATLAQADLQLLRGEKPGVWVVGTSAGIVVGALDRIVRQRRAQVAARMEGYDDSRIGTVRTDPAGAENRCEDRTSSEAPGASGREGRPEPDRDDPGMPRRDIGGTARHPGQPGQDRGGNRPSAGRRIRDRAAVKALGAAISVPDVKAEAARRYLKRRLEELRQFHDDARAKLETARAPLVPPDSFAQAQLHADRAQRASKATLEAMRSAEARHDAILAGMPRGVSAWAAWISGRARRHAHEAAEAAQDATRARRRHEAADRLAAVFRASAGVEDERMAAWRVEAVAVRRQLADVAEHEMATALLAARMLKRDPTLAALSVRQLVGKADSYLRQRDTHDRLSVRAACAPRR